MGEPRIVTADGVTYIVVPPWETLTQERIAAALDSEKVADMMGGGFESGEITMLSRYLAEALRDAV